MEYALYECPECGYMEEVLVEPNIWCPKCTRFDKYFGGVIVPMERCEQGEE